MSDQIRTLLLQNLKLEKKKYDTRVGLNDVNLKLLESSGADVDVSALRAEKEKLEREIKLLSFEQSKNRQNIQKKTYYAKNKELIKQRGKENYIRKKNEIMRELDNSLSKIEDLEIKEDLVVDSEMKK